MEFRIADSFTASLARLTAREQKAAKMTAFDLQMDAAADTAPRPGGAGRPGLAMHRLDRAADPDFWSVRVNDDLRMIVHRLGGHLLLVYVDHHDAAYRWAARRRIARHPVTGAMQMIVLAEQVAPAAMPPAPKPILAPAMADVPQEPYHPPLFLDLDDAALLGIGVPPNEIQAVRNASSPDFFDVAERLPQEAVEALLAYVSTGILPEPAAPGAAMAVFEHPDDSRRFRAMRTPDELRQALEFPWDRWTVFLHPEQRRLVERQYAGPVRIAGSAGTGKTVVAVHRAVHMARRDPRARVLLTTISPPLAAALAQKLARLAGNDGDLPARITTRALTDVAMDAYTARFGPPRMVDAARLGQIIARHAGGAGAPRHLRAPFLAAEWGDVVDARSITDAATYRQTPRLGRRTRLGPRQRDQIWQVMAAIRADLAADGLITPAQMLAAVTIDPAAAAGDPLAMALIDDGDGGGFDAVVVDEAQDIGPAELRFLAGLGRNRPDVLFFAGDLGQRIFRQPFSWKALGIDIRGRSHVLRVNYRTSHQIREQADRLLPGAIADVDGNADSRDATVSLFNGPAPVIRLADDPDAEILMVRDWLLDCLDDGISPDEIALIVRADNHLPRAIAAAGAAGLAPVILGRRLDTGADEIAVATMHTAKGLEFRAVAVMAADDDALPLAARIAAIGDEADLDDVYATERHLLYVACTRARDVLLITGVAPGSEFLGDMGVG